MATHDLGRLASEFDAAVYLSDGCQVPPPEGAFAGLPVGRSACGLVDRTVPLRLHADRPGGGHASWV